MRVDEASYSQDLTHLAQFPQAPLPFPHLLQTNPFSWSFLLISVLDFTPTSILFDFLKNKTSLYIFLPLSFALAVTTQSQITTFILISCPLCPISLMSLCLLLSLFCLAVLPQSSFHPWPPFALSLPLSPVILLLLFLSSLTSMVSGSWVKHFMAENTSICSTWL